MSGTSGGRALAIEVGINILVCTGIAGGLWLLHIGDSFAAILTVSLCFGLSFHFVSLVASRWTQHMVVRMLVATLVGLPLGITLSGLILEGNPFANFRYGSILILGAIFGPLATGPFLAVAASQRSRARLMEERIARLQQENAMAEANLRVLQAQVEPHFLFNTLSNLRALISQDDAKAVEMLDRLCSFLRSSFEQVDDREVPLAQELRRAEAYLAIHSVRLGSRFRYGVHADDELLDLLVPSFILQPLVENAIRHGVEEVDGPACVEVKAARRGEQLEILVVDDGPGLADPGGRSGVGLQNVRSRLQTIYGEKSASLTLQDGASGGVVATVVVPAQAKPMVP